MTQLIKTTIFKINNNDNYNCVKKNNYTRYK